MLITEAMESILKVYKEKFHYKITNFIWQLIIFSFKATFMFI